MLKDPHLKIDAEYHSRIIRRHEPAIQIPSYFHRQFHILCFILPTYAIKQVAFAENGMSCHHLFMKTTTFTINLNAYQHNYGVLPI